ncbi:hypothetical protein KCU98_g11624, partial [Aureobasidium melanogenum]
MADPTVPPDLASILATLAQFAPQQQQDQQQTPPPSATTPTITDPRLQRRQQSQNLQPTAQSWNQIQNQPQQNESQSTTSYNPQAAVFQPVNPQGRAPSQQSRTSAPQQQEQTIIDPATITEWSAGLRCVTKIAAQNPMFAEKIRGQQQQHQYNNLIHFFGHQILKRGLSSCTINTYLSNKLNAIFTHNILLRNRHGNPLSSICNICFSAAPNPTNKRQHCQRRKKKHLHTPDLLSLQSSRKLLIHPSPLCSL